MTSLCHLNRTGRILLSDPDQWPILPEFYPSDANGREHGRGCTVCLTGRLPLTLNSKCHINRAPAKTPPLPVKFPSALSSLQRNDIEHAEPRCACGDSQCDDSNCDRRLLQQPLTTDHSLFTRSMLWQAVLLKKIRTIPERFYMTAYRYPRAEQRQSQACKKPTNWIYNLLLKTHIITIYLKFNFISYS